MSLERRLRPPPAVPNTAPYGFIVKVVASVAGPPAVTGEDRRALYLHRDQDMLDGFPRKLGSDGESSPALVDLDGDNRNELVAGHGRRRRPRLHARCGDG